MTFGTMRQPIITVAGHVDHGKTSLLDCFRGSSVQAGEAGGITQKISFTKYPLEQIESVCPLIKKSGVAMKIPGFLFIDTPGHAAFTNLRKRGGALADLAILVVDIKKGIEPQTAEVIAILKANKTPFVIALNKIDNLSGWKKRDSIKESVESQALNVKEEFETCLLTFQGALQSHGFDSALYYELSDFTKKIAIVPCSARSKEGIPELLFVLCGLCQKFLAKQLELSEDAKGVILEVKKERGAEYAEAILYDGDLALNEEIAIASFGKPIVTKIRTLEEIQPLSFKYNAVKHATAATGVRMQLTEKEGILPGMPFQELKNNLAQITSNFKKEISSATKVNTQGIIAKADSLGSLEALLTLLQQANIHVLKAGIGPITKSDISSAKANLDNAPLDALMIGFNVESEEDVEFGKVTVFTDTVVYKLIDKVSEWRKQKQKEIEKEKLMGLATICKVEVLPQYVFRNSNPAIFGVRVIAGTLKTHIPLIDENDISIAHVKSIQVEKHTVSEATQGMELAISLPGVTFDRQLKETRFLYATISESQLRAFKKHKELLSADELKVLQEIADIKRKKNPEWGTA
ncbi:MAG: translation initiation factor IF-2 [Nanoarchaeota archaeon]